MLGQGRTILLVDDEPMNSMILQRRLSKEGFQIETASNGKEAVDYVERSQQSPDLILMDLMMPVMDGWQASKIIKKSHPSIRIIAVSAKTEEESVAQIFDGFSPKPINFESLLKKISHLLSIAA